jgi:hypothetical protein
MLKNKVSLILFLIFSSLFFFQELFAQADFFVRIEIKDLASQKPIPFVNIFNEKGKLIARANDSGYAVIKKHTTVLKISAVNYTDSVFLNLNLSENLVYTFYLVPKIYELPEFVLNASDGLNGDSIWHVFIKRFFKNSIKKTDYVLVQENALTILNNKFSDYREVIKSVRRDAVGFKDSRLVKARSLIDFSNDSSQISWVNIDQLKLTESIGLHQFGDFLIETNPFKNFSYCLKMKVESKYLKGKDTYFNFTFTSHPSCKNKLSGNVLVNFSKGKIIETQYEFWPQKSGLESLSGTYEIANLQFIYHMEFNEEDGFINLLTYAIKYNIVRGKLSLPVKSNGQIQLYAIDEKSAYTHNLSILNWRKINDFQLMREVALLGNELPFLQESRFNFIRLNILENSVPKQSSAPLDTTLNTDTVVYNIEKKIIETSKSKLIFDPIDGYFGFSFLDEDSLIAEFVFTTEIQYLPMCKISIKPILISSFTHAQIKNQAIELQDCLQNKVAEDLLKLEKKINKLKIKKYDLLRSTFEVYIAQYIKQFNEFGTLSGDCW